MKKILVYFLKEFGIELLKMGVKALAKDSKKKKDKYEILQEIALDAAEASIDNTYTEFTRDDLDFLNGKLKEVK